MLQKNGPRRSTLVILKAKALKREETPAFIFIRVTGPFVIVKKSRLSENIGKITLLVF